MPQCNRQLSAPCEGDDGSDVLGPEPPFIYCQNRVGFKFVRFLGFQLVYVEKDAPRFDCRAAAGALG